jgi:hypothetical protein
MTARLYTTFFTACLLFTAGAYLLLSLARWSAGDLATLVCEGQR